MRWALVLWSLVSSTVLSALAWGAALFFVSPEDATGFEWTLFVFALVLFLSGIGALLGLLVRRAIFGVDGALSRIGGSIRQGIFLAVFCAAMLFLKRAGWLAWWDAAFVFAFLSLIEIFFLRTFRSSERNKDDSLRGM